MQIIVVANQKGGVAKTTTAIHLAACAAKEGRKALLIDVDPQANSSLGLGVKPKDFEYGTADMFEDPGAELKLYRTEFDNLYLLPSDQSLARVEWEMWQDYKPEHAYILKNKLQELQELDNSFDESSVVIIDTPPSLGIFTINSLMAAKGVIIPVAPDPYSLIGLRYLHQTIDDIRFSANPRLKVYGFVRTMWDDRSNLSKSIDQQLNQLFPNKVFKTAIRINVRLREAAVAGMPVTEYEPSAPSSIAYQELYEEVAEIW